MSAPAVSPVAAATTGARPPVVAPLRPEGLPGVNPRATRSPLRPVSELLTRPTVQEMESSETADNPSSAESPLPVPFAEPPMVQAPAGEEERLRSLPSPPVRRRARTRQTARLIPAVVSITAIPKPREAPPGFALADEQQPSMPSRQRRPTPVDEVLSAPSEHGLSSPPPAPKPTRRAAVRWRVGPPPEPSRRRVSPVAPAAAPESRRRATMQERVPNRGRAPCGSAARGPAASSRASRKAHCPFPWTRVTEAHRGGRAGRREAWRTSLCPLPVSGVWPGGAPEAATSALLL